MNTRIDRMISSRKNWSRTLTPFPAHEDVAEGGCGVLGVCSSVPIRGRHLLQPMIQMHNRGNGKGGGIAAVGLSPSQLGVSRKTLEEAYLIQVANLDPSSRSEVEAEFIHPHFDVEFSERVTTINDHRSIGLETKPPDVYRYFVRVKEERLRKFIEKNGLDGLDEKKAEDELVYRNSFELNKKYYASLGDKRAFVLSHGKNMMVLKIVGYAEQVLSYYQLEDLEANIWIGHQRYPTKGKVWHPGGSHPFIGLSDALVHNGDFANYRSIVDYLKQRNMHPLFLTDTEVAALYWDLLTRVYEYPLEYAIEAIAPTTERDFAMLSSQKREIYRAIQATHIHGSPDGPWFFIIARNNYREKKLQLIGITDTSMLRPQVFALQEREAKIGLIASEKQAIDAMLRDLAKNDRRFHHAADLYWYARGGSYTDGGAFIFTIDESNNVMCTDKFGEIISAPTQRPNCGKIANHSSRGPTIHTKESPKKSSATELFQFAAKSIRDWKIDELRSFTESLASESRSYERKAITLEALTLLIDRSYDLGDKRRSDIIPVLEEALCGILGSMPAIDSELRNGYSLINYEKRNRLGGPTHSGQTLVIDASNFAPEGEEGTCQFLNKACELGWKTISAYNFRGQRNFGAGLVTRDKVKIDVYGSAGDCLAAFADGPEFYVHESAQDSVAYCLRSGKLVIFGDAGKAFGYGAKGGIAFVLGDLVDRPLINGVGSATAVINGSCKDYMGESFMAANGMIILNGIRLENGEVLDQETPYPGGNLFPLAAAGVVYLRDPRRTVGQDQLNGAEMLNISPEDWQRIMPLLENNERLFGIKVEDLLKVDGMRRRPEEVYRKVVPVQVAALAKYDTGI